MAESLLPIDVLCGDRWSWNPNDWFTAKFNKDGTGELYCRAEFIVFIASEFDWKAQSNLDFEASFPTTIDIDMTLTKRLMNSPRLPKEVILEDAAFQPKTYRLQLEEGSFLLAGRTTYGFNPTYKYRLLWDKSPYPPLDEWKKKGPAKKCKFWERKDFYKGQIEP